MQRYVISVAHHPAVVRLCRYAEEAASSQLDDSSVLERRHRCAGQHEANVLQGAQLRAGKRRNMHGPFPSRSIDGASDGHATDRDELESPLLESPHLVRVLEVPQINIDHRRSPIPYRVSIFRTSSTGSASTLACAPR